MMYIRLPLLHLLAYLISLEHRLVFKIPVKRFSVLYVTRRLDFVFVYLDDLLVTSPDHKTHKKHLRILFARLAEYGIIIGPEKCQFGTTELSFLGHHVCAEGISPLPSAVDAIVNFVKPEKQ